MPCVTFLFGKMTGIYTEEILTALDKAQLIDLFLKMQDQTNSTIDSLMAEMKDLNSSFKRIESDVQIVKTVNNNLLRQLENTEKSNAGQIPSICGVSAWRLLANQKQLSRSIWNILYVKFLIVWF